VEPTAPFYALGPLGPGLICAGGPKKNPGRRVFFFSGAYRRGDARRNFAQFAFCSPPILPFSFCSPHSLERAKSTIPALPAREVWHKGFFFFFFFLDSGEKTLVRPRAKNPSEKLPKFAPPPRSLNTLVPPNSMPCPPPPAARRNFRKPPLPPPRPFIHNCPSVFPYSVFGPIFRGEGLIARRFGARNFWAWPPFLGQNGPLVPPRPKIQSIFLFVP